MNLLDYFGTDLLPEEQEQVRTAADALVFCHRLEADREAREALRVASDLVLRRVICDCELGTGDAGEALTAWAQQTRLASRRLRDEQEALREQQASLRHTSSEGRSKRTKRDPDS